MKKITIKYDVFVDVTNEPYENIAITGEDEEDCKEQLEQYLDTKQNCYAFESEND